MRRAAGACVLAAGWAGAAGAAGPVPIDVPAGRLADALVAVGEQAGVSLGLADPVLGAMRVRGVHGRLDARRALDRLLAGTGAEALLVAPDVFRIVARPSHRPHPMAPLPPRIAFAPDAIVVTGSKRDAPLATYPGSVIVSDVGAIPLGTRARGSDALVSELPALSSTHLGPGRDKLFVRGIADSSFTGPTQSTVGQYLGEARLNYNAPDPDLPLYDIASVEVLEGPQGTLYGAGTLGGIIRLVPVMPDLSRFTIGASLGVADTRFGAGSGDEAALLNLPILRDRLGLRVLAYRSVEGGYIDDPGRGLADINRTRTVGGRVELRYRPAADWTIDVTAVAQNLNSRDGQYADGALPPLRRRSVFAEPFDNDYVLGGIVVRHRIGGVELVSATSLVRHDVDTDYDASLTAAAPRLYREQDHITLAGNETRVSHKAANGGGWVAGVAVLHSAERITRALGAPDALAGISGSRNAVTEAALFGEATISLLRGVALTGGGRVGFDSHAGEALDHPAGTRDFHRHVLVFLPSISLLWRIAPSFSAYARYQEGYRAGGLSVVSATHVRRFRGDSVATYEAGLRYGREGGPVEASAAISYAHWESVQADLVDSAGLPTTANIGNGRVVGFELRGAWRPIAGLTLAGGAFVNDSKLTDPALGLAGEKDATLPNIADLGLQARATYEWRIADGQRIRLTGAARYVGRSRLGIGPLLSRPQGGYVDTTAALSWTIRGVTLSIDGGNLLDTRRSQFALGDPFALATVRQVTPLRPRTIRFGIATGF